jgi:hypothetical protein
MLSGSVHNVNKNGEALLVRSKDNVLAVTADKTKRMVMSRDQNAELSHSIKIENSSF